jgi:hypothetical protein
MREYVHQARPTSAVGGTRVAPHPTYGCGAVCARVHVPSMDSSTPLYRQNGHATSASQAPTPTPHFVHFIGFRGAERGMHGSSLHRSYTRSGHPPRGRTHSLYASGIREVLLSRESIGLASAGRLNGGDDARLPPLEGTPMDGGRPRNHHPSRAATPPSTAPVLGRNLEELKALREENEALKRELLERIKGSASRGQMMAGWVAPHRPLRPELVGPNWTSHPQAH